MWAGSKTQSNFTVYNPNKICFPPLQSLKYSELKCMARPEGFVPKTSELLDIPNVMEPQSGSFGKHYIDSICN